MFKHSLPSIEKFAAFLDGNLLQSEMQQFSEMVEHDNKLQQIVNASSVIDDTILEFTDGDFQLPDEISHLNFDLPDLDNEDFSLVGDSFSDNEGLYVKEGFDADESLQQESETLKSSNDMAKSYRTYGESGENIYDPIFIKQPDDHSCGLRSQQIVLRDFGIDIPFEDLERVALEAGVYYEDGTDTYDIGKVLEMAGVGIHQVPGSTIYDLTNELAQGHRVIVTVDADELWYNDGIKGKLTNWFADVLGSQGGNHALIVAGVEVNPTNPNDVKVVLTDPGDGHLRIEYPLHQFMDAWKDSNCFMVATDEAAPYQYDIESGMEIPSNFYVEHNHNQFVVENSYLLNPDKINVPVGYQPAFKGHLNMVGSQTYEEFLLEHAHNSLDEATSFVSENHVGETSGSVGDSLLSPIGESDGSVGSHSLDRVGETAGSVGVSSQVGETTGSVETGLLSPIGETTGGVGDESLNSVGETTGGVGSDFLKPISETTGGIGTDEVESKGVNTDVEDSGSLSHIEETTGGVGSESLGSVGETTGGVGSSLFSGEGNETSFSHDEHLDFSLDEDF